MGMKIQYYCFNDTSRLRSAYTGGQVPRTSLLNSSHEGQGRTITSSGQVPSCETSRGDQIFRAQGDKLLLLGLLNNYEQCTHVLKV